MRVVVESQVLPDQFVDEHVLVGELRLRGGVVVEGVEDLGADLGADLG